MFVVIIKLKSHFQLSLILTIANAIVPTKLLPILTGQSQITACERKLLFVKETFESKNLRNVYRGLRRIWKISFEYTPTEKLSDVSYRLYSVDFLFD